ncbi:hypothetical protein GGR56DRAFT_296776 [Xylariaceae sp. FL0804]|nr:hypothetical protein GGR56DRAFT_296776 [Xylariaceae sp. FL0804]
MNRLRKFLLSCIPFQRKKDKNHATIIGSEQQQRDAERQSQTEQPESRPCFSLLPAEIKLMIFSELESHHDIASLRQSSRSLRRLYFKHKSYIYHNVLHRLVGDAGTLKLAVMATESADVSPRNDVHQGYVLDEFVMNRDRRVVARGLCTAQTLQRVRPLVAAASALVAYASHMRDDRTAQAPEPAVAYRPNERRRLVRSLLVLQTARNLFHSQAFRWHQYFEMDYFWAISPPETRFWSAFSRGEVAQLEAATAVLTTATIGVIDHQRLLDPNAPFPIPPTQADDFCCFAQSVGLARLHELLQGRATPLDPAPDDDDDDWARAKCFTMYFNYNGPLLAGVALKLHDAAARVHAELSSEEEEEEEEEREARARFVADPEAMSDETWDWDEDGWKRFFGGDIGLNYTWLQIYDRETLMERKRECAAERAEELKRILAEPG